MYSVDELKEFVGALEIEANALRDFAAERAGNIAAVVELLYGCRSRIAVIGMGKCGHVCRKIAATFASTGTPAVFIHPAEAIHGDLGFLDPDDVALVLSNSGETEEITAMLPHLKRRGIRIVGMTGRTESTLARHSELVIDTSVAREADFIDIAPTASTTLMLAIGDALACVLMKKRGFGRENYALFHPGGSLGNRLLCKVSDLMHTGKDIPSCSEDVPLADALLEVTSKRLGITLALDEEGKLTGVLTDGDIRRIFQRDSRPLDLPLRSVMTRTPKTVTADMSAADALRFMEDELITALPVLDAKRRPEGVLHIHDIIRVGIS